MIARRATLTAILAAIAALGGGTMTAAAGQKAPAALHDEIARQDAAMFEAFNAHDADKLMTFLADDLEFYHDKDGLLSHAQVFEGFRRLFAPNNGLRRDLVPGSLEVYPIPGYGALELGAHKFCHVENGKDDCGVFRFTHVWRTKDGRWRVTRILSYDHGPQ